MSKSAEPTTPQTSAPPSGRPPTCSSPAASVSGSPRPPPSTALLQATPNSEFGRASGQLGPGKTTAGYASCRRTLSGWLHGHCSSARTQMGATSIGGRTRVEQTLASQLPSRSGQKCRCRRSSQPPPSMLHGTQAGTATGPCSSAETDAGPSSCGQCHQCRGDHRGKGLHPRKSPLCLGDPRHLDKPSPRGADRVKIHTVGAAPSSSS